MHVVYIRNIRMHTKTFEDMYTAVSNKVGSEKHSPHLNFFKKASALIVSLAHPDRRDMCTKNNLKKSNDCIVCLQVHGKARCRHITAIRAQRESSTVWPPHYITSSAVQGAVSSFNAGERAKESIKNYNHPAIGPHTTRTTKHSNHIAGGLIPEESCTFRYRVFTRASIGPSAPKNITRENITRQYRANLGLLSRHLDL
jgi:hypothetical protein